MYKIHFNKADPVRSVFISHAMTNQQFKSSGLAVDSKILFCGREAVITEIDGFAIEIKVEGKSYKWVDMRDIALACFVNHSHFDKDTIHGKN